MAYKTLTALFAVLILGCAPRRPSITESANFKTLKDSLPYNEAIIVSILKNSYSGEIRFDEFLKDKEHRIQIIYTQIDRNAKNEPVLTDYTFNNDPQLYFYPASTVKMPVAFLALQKLNELKVAGLDRNTTMINEAAYSGQTAVYNDPHSEDGRPTIANYIKKIFLVSDNDAYNRLYEFLGQEYINRTLHKMGYDSVQIVHRLEVALSDDENRATNPIRFYDTSGKTIYQQALLRSNLVYQPRQTFLGKGYYSRGKLINQPFDFSKKNRVVLSDLHSILKSVLFPEAVPAEKRFNLTDDDYSFLYKYMSMMPRESLFPQYDTAYPDAYVKFLGFGARGSIPPAYRIFNKVGDAYGFLTDVAYIVDFERNIEFMLSATIHCNSDGIYNDDHYDYETKGFPFMKALGEAFMNYEIGRKRKHAPDLSSFKLNYTH
jgi:hypothetical protein